MGAALVSLQDWSEARARLEAGLKRFPEDDVLMQVSAGAGFGPGVGVKVKSLDALSRSTCHPPDSPPCPDPTRRRLSSS